MAGLFNSSQELDGNNNNAMIIDDSSKVENNLDICLHTKDRNSSGKVTMHKPTCLNNPLNTDRLVCGTKSFDDLKHVQEDSK